MIPRARLLVAVLGLVAGCSTGPAQDADQGVNPFLGDQNMDKADTGYVNLKGMEVEVTVEADVEASSWRVLGAPADLTQFAVTYLRTHKKFYLEILGEDATAGDRLEWLVDGQWLSSAQARDMDKSKLKHFRYKDVDAVVMYSDAEHAEVGTVYEAKVPIRPYRIMDEAAKNCADEDHHLGLSQSIYWYLWNPDKRDCNKDLLQTMTLTVTEVLPRNPDSYPEYDKLWEDGRLDVAVFFGQLDDGDVTKDGNWNNVKKLAKWLTDADFEEITDVDMGRRFIKHVGDLTEVVDIYGPDVFHNVADYGRFENWQKAVNEHEVIMYNGHSVLGTGMAFERAVYPDKYQIFQVASCLSYEYYVRPILAGKGGWQNVDVIANTTPTFYYENLPLTSTILAKLMWGFEHEGRTSWQEIMKAASRAVGHYRFGVSGARGNCFSPEGDRCNTEPEPEGNRYENNQVVEIPDNDPSGIESQITVPDDGSIAGLKVDLNISHTWVGDLEVVLSHDGVDQVLWSRDGGSDDNIEQTFKVEAFDGNGVAGTWTLRVVDHARRDVGQIQSWAIDVTLAQ